MTFIRAIRVGRSIYVRAIGVAGTKLDCLAAETNMNADIGAMNGTPLTVCVNSAVAEYVLHRCKVAINRSINDRLSTWWSDSPLAANLDSGRFLIPVHAWV